MSESARVIGVLGGGQLGLMLGEAARRLGLTPRFLDPNPEAPARQVGELLVGSYEDPELLARLAAGADVLTYEFENVPLRTVYQLAEHHAVHPRPEALRVAQDRIREKRFFALHQVPTPPFLEARDRDGLEDAVRRLGVPCVVKTRQLGYDGKGQFLVRDPHDLPRAWEALAFACQPDGCGLIVEAFVPFEREVSLLAVRSRGGEVRCWPLIENHHRGGILRWSIAPAPDLPAALREQAEQYGRRIMEALDYVGVLAIEFFVSTSGSFTGLVANEMAPRVHNSGHWTIEGAATSQFTAHLGAILGLPLGDVTVAGAYAMLNFIGTLPPEAARAQLNGLYWHLYGKTPRPGRKLGHATAPLPADRDPRAHVAGLMQALGIE